jgi:hypothetical protein
MKSLRPLIWSSLVLSCLALCLWPGGARADLIANGVDIGRSLGANSPLYNFYDYPFFEGGFPEGAKDVQAIQVAPIYNIGGSLSGTNRKLVPGVNQTDALVMLFQWVYFYPWQPPDPHFTFSSDLFFDYLTVHANTSEPLGTGVGGGGLGDVLWTPLGIGISYQHWKYENWVKPTGYISPLISFPAGAYNKTAAFNIGSNAWSVTPAFIGWTYLGKNFGALDGSEWQTDLIYSHVFSPNNEYPTPAPLVNTLGQFTTYEPGDTLVFNNAFLFPILKDLKAGIGVTYTQSLSAPDIGGFQIHSSEVQELGLGPAFMTHVGKINLWFSYAADVLTKNVYRQEGFYLTADYAFPTTALFKNELPSWIQ